ncbi:hypothetical protein P7H74_12620 [Enterococcus devriesei]|nr:hypothetical protein [Enterococcus devriesei]MDT2822588.1 hypothetical protein [Enterococcus devriesei]
MTFKHIIVFTVKEFNKNTEKDGYLPQNGVVINAFVNSTGFNSVTVGYEK